jgi:hypothetical protein
MNKKFILFGAFLSTFILILVPNISCVNANIQNENNLNIKNRILNFDCNCQKSYVNNSSGPINYILCWALLSIIFILMFPYLYIDTFQIDISDYELLIWFLNAFIPGISVLLEVFDTYCGWIPIE